MRADGTPERGILSRLDPAARMRLRAIATRKTYSNGQLIHQRGDRRAGVDFIISGMVRMAIVGKTGHVIASGVLWAGDMFGEITVFGRLPRMQDAHALGTTVIDHVAAARLRMFLEEFPSVIEQILELMARRQARTIAVIDDILRLSVVERLGRQLLEFDRMGGGKGIVAAGKNELAEQLGASRVAVSNALAQLAAAGFVRSGYSRVEILDGPGLKAWLSARNDSMPIGKLDPHTD